MVEDAKQALRELPSIYQSIGKVAMRAKRCKPHSKLGKQLWDEYDRLNNEGSRLVGIISIALRHKSI